MGMLEDDLDEGVRRCVEAGHDSWTTHKDGSPCTASCPVHPDYSKPKPVRVYGSLREANTARQALWGGDIHDAAFHGLELGGEAGEVLNVVKKLERERKGLAGSRATVADLAAELGDVVICCDLLAKKYGINLEQATANKFNATSEKMGFDVRLFVPPALEAKP